MRRSVGLFAVIWMLMGLLMGCGAVPESPDGLGENLANQSAIRDDTDATAQPTTTPTTTSAGSLSGPGGVPVFPQAQTVQAGTMMATIVETIEEQMQAEVGYDLAVDVHLLPGDVSFAAVEAHYADALEPLEWQRVADQLGIEGASAAAWTDPSGRFFAVVVMDDPTQSGDQLLITQTDRER